MRILAIYYSHSGDTAHALREFLAALSDRVDAEIVLREISTDDAYPKPWTTYTFFDASSDVIGDLSVPVAIVDQSGSTQFDCVVVGWPVWFLRPAPAIRQFLRSDEAANLLRGTPVVSICSCRQMWMRAFDRFKAMLRPLDAPLIAHVVLNHRGGAKTLVTTPWRLALARKENRATADDWQSPFDRAATGRLHDAAGAVATHLNDRKAGLPPTIVSAKFYPDLELAEQFADRFFSFWRPVFQSYGRRGQKSRRLLVHLFTTILTILVVVLLPPLWIVGKLANAKNRQVARSTPSL